MTVLYPVDVLRADCFEACASMRDVPLVIVDPPYGGIVDQEWDRVWTAANYGRLGLLVEGMLAEGGTAYVWGGVGKPGRRPFFEWLSRVEDALPRTRSGKVTLAEGKLHVHNLLTWKKKRAYGKADDYLFTREECAMLVKGPKPATFHKPLLSEKRGYAGYSAKYPAHSEYLRVTNVWTDITEIFRGKIHPCEKPSALADRMIRASSNEGDLVVDPMAGSGSTGVAARRLGRRCTLVEMSDCPMRPLDGAQGPGPGPGEADLEEVRVRWIVTGPDGRLAEVMLDGRDGANRENTRFELTRGFTSLWDLPLGYGVRAWTEDEYADAHPERS